MVEDILEQAGFVENQTYRRCRFIKPPQITYAVYFDEFEARGSDDKNLLEEHDCTIEMYSYALDEQSQMKIENALNASGIAYRKASHQFLEDEQLYMVVYEFDYITKKED